jgi:hypothetical protein
MRDMNSTNVHMKIAATITIVVLLLSHSICCGSSFSRDYQADSVKAHRVRNVRKYVQSPSLCLYAEMFGAGAGMLSIHGEVTAFRFPHNPDGLGICHSLRFSVGYVVQELFLPIAAKLILFESDHHLETGIGLTFPLKDRGGSDGYPAAAAMGVFILGYRYEPQEGGFLFRVNYSPFIDTSTGEVASFFFGLSLGFAI